MSTYYNPFFVPGTLAGRIYNYRYAAKTLVEISALLCGFINYHYCFPCHINNYFYPLPIFTGEHKQEAFTKINPVQLVPVIDDNGFVLTERHVIQNLFLMNFYITMWIDLFAIHSVHFQENLGGDRFIYIHNIL